ncbi:MAG: iron-sulfur cluster assembly accessory protein [Deltaproteobacteria bacterium]|nr:iron-sulfur cluster assembly accessory protein [Deltaproteobacteria bacterium]
MPETDLNTSVASPDAAAVPYVPVSVTEKAITMIKITREQEGIDANYGLRVAVRGGGCSGFEYALDFEEAARETDWVYEQGDLQLFVDPVSARYLEGTEIDYVLGTTGAGFKFNNPKAVGSCGCGSSFSV